MRPSLRLQRLAVGWLGLALVCAFLPSVIIVWLLTGILLVVVALTDAWRQGRRPMVWTERKLADAISVGTWTEVQLDVHNPDQLPVSVQVFDHAPGTADLKNLPLRLVLPAGGRAHCTYGLRPCERGSALFGRTELLTRSPLGLWHRRSWSSKPQSLRVYPDFAPVMRYALLALENRASQMGIRRSPRRGSGLEFHQLREYREEDRLQQIDWKATSRRGKLISREYQEERDQNVLFLVDAGRRMRSMDGELSHFDHCLNSILLLTYVGLRQGDSVGVLTFGGDERWLPPVKGSRGLTTILNGIFDFQPSTAPSDFLAAARRTIALQKRRSLVVLLTNLRGEDASDLEPALQVLRKRHLVLVVSLRERSIEAMLERPIANLEDALDLGAAELYHEARSKIIEHLRFKKIRALDVTAQELPIALANKYLEIKRAGAL